MPAIVSSTPSTTEATKKGDLEYSPLALLKGLPIWLWKDRIFGKCFEPTDRADRRSMVQALLVSRNMFAASAGALYSKVPVKGLSYSANKQLFENCILKSNLSSRELKGRHYGSMIRVLNLDEMHPKFVEKKVNDTNLQAILTLCTCLQGIAIPFSRRQPPKQLSGKQSKREAPEKSASSENQVNVTDCTLRSIAKITNEVHISTLKLDNVYDFSIAELENLLKRTFDLQFLQLQGRFSPKGTTPKEFGSSLARALVNSGAAKRLKSIHLSDLMFDAESWTSLWKSIGKANRLTHVSLTNVPTASQLVSALCTLNGGISQNLVSFTSIMTGIADENDQIGDAPFCSEFLVHESKVGSPNLRVLNIQYSKLTDACLRTLSKYPPLALQSLTLLEAEIGDVLLLAETITNCPRLNWLDLTGCRKIQHNPNWASVFNQDPKHPSSDQDEEPWWMNDTNEFVIGTRRLQEIRDCTRKRQAGGT
jgi:hypothetical protein